MKKVGRTTKKTIGKVSQFFVKFKDGTTIYMQPENMAKGNTGLPVLDIPAYLKNHHPERLEEYNRFLKSREKYWKKFNQQLKKQTGGQGRGSRTSKGNIRFIN